MLLVARTARERSGMRVRRILVRLRTNQNTRFGGRIPTVVKMSSYISFKLCSCVGQIGVIAGFVYKYARMKLWFWSFRYKLFQLGLIMSVVKVRDKKRGIRDPTESISAPSRGIRSISSLFAVKPDVICILTLLSNKDILKAPMYEEGNYVQTRKLYLWLFHLFL